MKKNMLFFLILAVSRLAYADPKNVIDHESCEKLTTSSDNDFFVDYNNYAKCDEADSGSEEAKLKYDKIIADRYPWLTTERIHKAAKVNEFKAKQLMGNSYFVLESKFKRVSTNSQNTLIFEVYNGGGNKYIYDSIYVPIDEYTGQLNQYPIWYTILKEANKKLPDLEDGDKVTFVCNKNNWRVTSPYSESFYSCVFFG
ncbi:hypothetical protein AC790_09010 [Pantoea sp. RIT-PI-b]|uniref:hypothetical protein n=1 Tax=Pantoea sp. RIT-PI-b TaxID=1681195 RepID=UPI0006A06B72|nr:hypothetical protein [Pantoea sp. RIT-PI-b]KNC14326.1 hypothetical protein AC790_09010 [Pantoea sp. RIT-PI-b]